MPPNVANLFLISKAGANFANFGPGDAGLKPCYHFTYDFAVLGGAQGTIALTQHDGPLPTGFIATASQIRVVTPLGSAGAALAALTTGQAANDLVVAAVIAGVPWSAAGVKLTLNVPSAIGILQTAARSPALVITAADLNAGKFELWIEGYGP